MLIFKGDDLFNSIKGGGGAVIKKNFQVSFNHSIDRLFLVFYSYS